MRKYLIEANISDCKKWHLVVDKYPGIYFVEEDFEEEVCSIDAYRKSFPDNEIIDIKEEIGDILVLLSKWEDDPDLDEANRGKSCKRLDALYRAL